MNICFLYANPLALQIAEWLESEGHFVVRHEGPLASLSPLGASFDLVVSFTYRYYIPQTIIEEVNGAAVNVHISYLPWNRGADPNMWSWIDDTPKGVSIHFVTDIIDGGDIIAQKTTAMTDSETLSSSYHKLMADAFLLFTETFRAYPYWNQMRKQTCARGSFHSLCQLDPYREQIDYFMSVTDFRNMIKQERVKDESSI